MPAIDQILGFNKVVNYNLFPGWHQPFTAQYMLINGDEWAETTDQQKALIETTCTAATMMGLSEGEWKNPSVLEGFREKGVNADQIPRETLAQLKDVTQEVLAEEAANDADFKRVYESQQKFMDQYSAWSERAYLPPDLEAK
jgi:TRAP-type mannitol/chloroaromatic compound transport system substrate-binding protein